MKTTSQLLIASLIATSLSTGCRSGGSSKWAWWNPMSKAAEDTSLVARTAPKLPSDTAEPLVEGVDEPPPSALAASETPDADALPKPKIAAVTPPPIETTPSTGSTAPPFKATTTPEPKAVVASAGPYDPDAYPSTTPDKVTTPEPESRYAAAADRYASTATPPDVAPLDFSGKLDAPTPESAANAVSNRYGLGDRYASKAPAAPVPTVETPYPSTPAKTPEASLPKLSDPPTPSGVASIALPTPSTPAPAGPLPGEADLPAKIGTIPAASAYAVATPETTSPQPAADEIQLTSLPGEYRPGGTGTYRAGLSVASRPGETGGSQKDSSAVAPTTDSPSRYR